MSYEKLHRRFKRIGDLNHALSILQWDEASTMPTGGGEVRAESLATLEGMVHEMVAGEVTGELADAALNEGLDPWQAANVDLIQREWRKARAVPGDLVIARSKATSACEQAWRPARPENDWRAVTAKLETVLALTREEGQALADVLVCDPYDALLDGYQAGLTRADIDPLFAQLRDVLPPLIDQAIDRQSPPLPIHGTFGIDHQEALGRALMAALGFDFERGLLGVSHHPFCGGEPDDTRITTRYNEQDFLESMFAVLHETGHALYQQGLPKAWRGQPVGDAGRHGAPREPVAVDGNAGLPRRGVPGVRGADRTEDIDRRRDRSGQVAARQPAETCDPGSPQLHSGGGGRIDLSAARHPALRTRDGAVGRQSDRRGYSRCLAREDVELPWGSPPKATSRAAACRTCTGSPG